MQRAQAPCCVSFQGTLQRALQGTVQREQAPCRVSLKGTVQRALQGTVQRETGEAAERGLIGPLEFLLRHSIRWTTPDRSGTTPAL